MTEHFVHFISRIGLTLKNLYYDDIFYSKCPSGYYVNTYTFLCILDVKRFVMRDVYRKKSVVFYFFAVNSMFILKTACT